MNNRENVSIGSSVESSSERYRGRIDVMEKLVETLHAKNGSYDDNLEGIPLPGNRVVRVALGIGDYLRNGTKNSQDFLRVYLQNEDNEDDGKVEWESLSIGDKRDILKKAAPEGNFDGVL